MRPCSPDGQPPDAQVGVVQRFSAAPPGVVPAGGLGEEVRRRRRCLVGDAEEHPGGEQVAVAQGRALVPTPQGRRQVPRREGVPGSHHLYDTDGQ